MRRYLLDTGILAALLYARPSVVSLITPWLKAHQVATRIVVYAEVIEYLKARAHFTTHHIALRTLLTEVYPYSFTYPILERYADIRRSMRKPHGGGLIGDIDTLIAATALERNLTVVTYDADFARVPDLSVKLLSRSN